MDTTAGKDDNDLPFGNLSDTISGGILISIIAIVAVFGLPVFILFVIFFFRYKNRKARYRLAEQAIAAGQPLPENFIRENRPADQRSQGIKNTFTGIAPIPNSPVIAQRKMKRPIPVKVFLMPCERESTVLFSRINSAGNG
jgi:hypothetical protein